MHTKIRRRIVGAYARWQFARQLGAAERGLARAAMARMEAAGGGRVTLGDAALFSAELRQVVHRLGYATWREGGTAGAPAELVGHVLRCAPAPACEASPKSWPTIDVAVPRRSRRSGTGSPADKPAPMRPAPRVTVTVGAGRAPAGSP